MVRLHMMTYTIHIENADDWWFGWVCEFPGVNGQGRTRDDLLRTIASAWAEAVEMNLPEERPSADI